MTTARLGALFVLSGLGALVVETVWMRWFRLLLGATAPAASATLVAFMTGQALGALAGARLARRTAAPLRTYGVLELGAAAAALATPLVLDLLGAGLDAAYDALLGHPVARTAARFGVALAASLPAAAAMGATLPVATAAVGRGARPLGRRGAVLYGLNTLGAAGGAALAGFGLPERIGVSGTYAVGVGALATAGLVALATAARGGAGRAAAAPDAAGPEPRAPARRGGPAAQPARPGAGLAPGAALALAALSGAGALAAQVLLVQAFARVLNQSTAAFAAVLVVVLAALALGALAMATLARRPAGAPRGLLPAALAAAGAGLLAFPALLVAATDGLTYVGTEAPWPGYLLAALGLAAGTAGPALLAAALVFPAVLDATPAGAPTEAGRRMGRLLAANTAGAVGGALLAPWVLLPALGLPLAFAAVGAAYGAAALAVAARGPAAARRPGRTRRWSAAAVAAVALALAAAAVLARPWAQPARRETPGERVLAMRSTPAGLVAVVERDGERLIQTDNHYALGGSRDRVHQERQGHLPLLLHPAPRRVAFLGSATGSSAGAALAHPVERLWLVEIVPAVSALAARHFADVNRGVHADPRTRVVDDDARNFLASTDRRFDVVVGDLFVPWRSGTGALYAAEHFRAARERLAPGGLFCQWLPLYQLSSEELASIAATFLDAFPRSAVFRGDFYGRFPIAALVGFADAAPEPGGVAARARSLAARGERDRWVAHPAGPFALYAGPLAALASRLADAPRNTDDRPVIEFRAARSHAGAGAGKRDAVVGAAWLRWTEALRAGLGPADPVFPQLPPQARRAAAGGAALQRAGALFVGGRTAEAGRAFADAAALLPPELVAEAPPDPTAAEVWGGG